VLQKLLALAAEQLAGRKTYLAAAGLLVLAVFHASHGDFVNAGMALANALAAFGIRDALAKAGI
jgi:hypothetical protein